MSAGERLPGTPTPMHTWTGAGGLTIAGDTWGDPNGPLVVLQHGGGQTRHAWRGTLAITQWLLMLEVMVIPGAHRRTNTARTTWSGI